MKKKNIPIRLRKFEERDIVRKIAWVHDPRINRFLHHELPLTENKIRKWLRNMEKENRHDLVIETLEGKAIGTIGLENLNEQHRMGEYYICIGNPEYFGTSVSSNAVRLLMDYAFLQLGLNKVYGVTETGNVKSMALMANFGFKYEGVLRQNYMTVAGPRDGMCLSFLANDYKIRKASLSEKRNLYESVILELAHHNFKAEKPRYKVIMPVNSEEIARLSLSLQEWLRTTWFDVDLPRPLQEEVLLEQFTNFVIKYHATRTEKTANGKVWEYAFWEESVPVVSRILTALTQADISRRRTQCGLISIVPTCEEVWKGLLDELNILSQYLKNQDSLTKAEARVMLQQIEAVCVELEVCQPIMPLTPALWQAIYQAFTASLMVLDIKLPVPPILLSDLSSHFSLRKPKKIN